MQNQENSKKQEGLLKYLERELETMVGFKLFMDNLKDAYLETSIWLADHTAIFKTEYQKVTETLIKNQLSISEALEASGKQEKYYIELLFSIFQELKERNIPLTRAKIRKP